MLEFPTTKDLLGELVSKESHTPKGERAIAEFIAHFAERWKLGAVTMHEYPPNAKFASLSPSPLNVTIDINPQDAAKPGEMLWFGHFDSIDPVENYADEYHGDPYQLFLDPEDSDVAHGLKSADMAAGIVSMLTAAYRLRESRDRIRHSIRILCVGGEEGQSHGIFAAVDPSNNLIRGSRCAISGDVEVGTSILDPPLICIGRPGRVGLRLTVHGAGMHSGSAHTVDPMCLASIRESLIKLRLPFIAFPERDERHFRELMPKTTAVAREWGSRKQRNMTVPGAATIDIDVINSNPALDSASIIDVVRREAEAILRSHNAWNEGAVSYSGEAGRETPFLKPYLEEPHHPFVRTVSKCFDAVSGRPPVIKAGKGTADEGAVVHEEHIPCVILPPICEDIHTERERVRLSSIDRNAKVLEKLALHNGPLTD